MARYPGIWYEVASANLGFLDGCSCSAFDYIMTDKNHYTDRFTCNKNGKKNDIDVTLHGTIPDINKTGDQYEGPSKWLPVSAPYLITEVAEDYSYAVVYSCVNLYVSKGEYIYIFHRERNGLKKIDLNGIKQRLSAQGVDVSAIKVVPQEGCDA